MVVHTGLVWSCTAGCRGRAVSSRHRPQRSAMHTTEGAKTLCSGSYKLFNKTLSPRTNKNRVPFVRDEKNGKRDIRLSQLGQNHGMAARPLEGQGSLRAGTRRSTWRVDDAPPLQFVACNESDRARTPSALCAAGLPPTPSHRRDQPLEPWFDESLTASEQASTVAVSIQGVGLVPPPCPSWDSASQGAAFVSPRCPNWDSSNAEAARRLPTQRCVGRSGTCHTQSQPIAGYLMFPDALGLFSEPHHASQVEVNRINVLRARGTSSVEHFVPRAPRHPAAENSNTLIYNDILSIPVSGSEKPDPGHFAHFD